MTRKRTAVLVAGMALGLLAPMTPATAATKTVNIIRDSGAESAKPYGPYGATVPVPLWKPSQATGFTAVKYGTLYFITKNGPGPKSRGHNFFAGGDGAGPYAATQVDSLTPYLALISSGKAKFTLSGWFGGYAYQRDYATLRVTWENAAGAAVGKPKPIGDVTAAQRKNITGLLARSTKGTVPTSATQALVTVKMVRVDGGYDDGYADNLSLVISR